MCKLRSLTDENNETKRGSLCESGHASKRSQKEGRRMNERTSGPRKNEQILGGFRKHGALLLINCSQFSVAAGAVVAPLSPSSFAATMARRLHHDHSHTKSASSNVVSIRPMHDENVGRGLTMPVKVVTAAPAAAAAVAASHHSTSS